MENCDVKNLRLETAYIINSCKQKLKTIYENNSYMIYIIRNPIL